MIDIETERGRDTGRGRSRLHAGSPTWDSIPGLESSPGLKADAQAEPPRRPKSTILFTTKLTLNCGFVSLVLWVDFSLSILLVAITPSSISEDSTPQGLVGGALLVVTVAGSSEDYMSV